MQKVEITHKTIIFTALFLLFLKFLWIVKDLMFSLFIAFILMSALKPLVDFLARRKIPRGLAAFGIYILFVGFFVEVITFALPPLIIESAHLLRSLPQMAKAVSPTLVTFFDLESLSSYLPNIANQFFGVIKSIFSNTIFSISTLFFGYYFLAEESLIRNLLIRFFEKERAEKVAGFFDQVEKRMSAWFWGELILMTIIGLMTFIGLNLIGIKYVLPLAVLAGLLEAIPNLGPVISVVPAALIGFSTSYFLGFSTVALYFIVQQLENNLIVPIIMKRAVGLNPIVTLIALIIGGKIGGVLGIILAIPTTLFLETIVVVMTGQKRKEQPLR